MESLQGNFLIATPQMPDPRFAERVIYICVHSAEEGAMGLVINNPLADITFEDIFRNAEIPLPAGVLPPLYLGGPVETTAAFFLFSSEYSTGSYLDISTSVRLSRDPAILYDISAGKGPKEFITTLGYSGWAPGQLEHELSVDGWLILPATDEIIFRTPDDLKWKKAAKLYGIDIELFGDVVGSA